MNTAFPKLHCFGAISNRQEVSRPQMKPWETAKEAKASGLVVG